MFSTDLEKINKTQKSFWVEKYRFWDIFKERNFGNTGLRQQNDFDLTKEERRGQSFWFSSIREKESAIAAYTDIRKLSKDPGKEIVRHQLELLDLGMVSIGPVKHSLKNGNSIAVSLSIFLGKIIY